MIFKTVSRAILRSSAPALLLLLSGQWHAASCAGLAPESPKVGFVVHFDFISNAAEGRQLVQIAATAGAKVINVVPPARIWKRPVAVKMLDAILDEIARRKLSFVFARIDASYPPDSHGERFNYLYGRILTTPGVLPDGAPTVSWFLTTTGRPEYANWMEEETRFYAKRYGGLPNLLGINLGPFSEPFSAERCGFLQLMRETGRFEITQYTPYAAKLWHRWLREHFGTIRAANQEYASTFPSLDQVPLPRNEGDERFGKPELAFFDFVRVLNGWFEERYERCRRIWHEVSGRKDVPLILQFNGFELEKLVNGRPSYMGFDLPGWVARADAVGLSVYTNSGYDDFGHSSVKATVNFLALAKELGKEVFVLESGCEAPNVVLDPGEVEFISSVALKLHPQTFIYEFLKETFDEAYPSNPGKLVTAHGEVRQPALTALQDMFRRIESTEVELEPPALYAVFDPMAARENLHAGEVAAALYDLASDVPVRWIPKGVQIKMRPGIPMINPNGSVVPANAKLSQLLEAIPAAAEPETPERAAWRKDVVDLLRLSGS